MGIGGTGARFADARDLQRVEHAVARDPRGNRPTCRGLRVGSRGDRQLARLGARRGLGGRARRRAAALRPHLARGGRRPGVRGAQRADLARAGRGASRAACSSRASRSGSSTPQRTANFPRANVARRDGLHAAFGFPLLSPRGVVGVMEFFSRELREPDERLLETMRELGSQVGQFVARRHAEEAVHASESRLRAMLEAALDAVVTMDHRGTRRRLEPCGRDDVRLSRATRPSAARWPS